MRKKTMLTVFIAAFAALIAIGATAAYTKQSQVSDFATALTINGVPVAAGEFRIASELCTRRENLQLF